MYVARPTVTPTQTTSFPCCGCACVAESEFAMIERCGKFSNVATPGCACVPCCAGLSVAGVVSTRLQQIDVSCETQTLDHVFVTLKINVHYSVLPGKERQAFYTLEEPHSQINAYVYDVVRSSVPRMPLDKVFQQKNDVALAVKEELQKAMTDYGWQIIQVLCADIVPDAAVRDAMNEINQSQRLRVAALDKAESLKIQTVKKSEAEADAKYLGGVGIARQRKAIADGLRDSVAAFQGMTSTNAIMEMTLCTQYFDVLRELAEKSHATTVFLPGTSGAGAGHPVLSDQVRQGMLEALAARAPVPRPPQQQSR